jgi:hypothetical protein
MRPIEDTGFTPPPHHPLGHQRRIAAVAELLASVVLALSTVLVITVVAAGAAYAQVADAVIGHEAGLFVISLLLGLLLLGAGMLAPIGEPKKP